VIVPATTFCPFCDQPLPLPLEVEGTDDEA
jgi:hypothetical protein